MDEPPFTFAPLTPDRLQDAAAVFGGRADSNRCWCCYWYRPQAEYKAGRGDENQAFFAAIVKTRPAPGILAYRGDEPAGWCGVAPRRNFDRLNRSKSFAPVDDTPVWSITCFIVRKSFRRQGLMRLMLRRAVDLARDQGATSVEAYPMDNPHSNPGNLYPGTLSAFLDEGFVEVARRLPTRPIVRRELG